MYRDADLRQCLREHERGERATSGVSTAHGLSACGYNPLHVVHAVALEDFAADKPDAEPEYVRGDGRTFPHGKIGAEVWQAGGS